jgi:glutamate synthase domain-containing protein 2/glutamate synthase domain-containing protein 1/glutamate synthase domain-containing protein 3
MNQSEPSFCQHSHTSSHAARSNVELPSTAYNSSSINTSITNELPAAQGLYDPAFEHDACGVGFVAHLHGERSHEIVRQGLEILKNLEHRGASGCDPLTGDGAGILTQIPDAFFRRISQEGRLLEQQRKDSGGLYTSTDATFQLPEAGKYGVGMVFLPTLPKEQFRVEAVINAHLRAEGLTILGWRDVPTNPEAIGETARASQPYIRQVFVSADHLSQDALERKLYVVRSMVSKEVARIGLQQAGYFYIASFSTRKICYKGLLQPEQMDAFYTDLSEHDYTSALALVHQRFSTNTFPSWKLAHPYRFLAHNGEINTLRGNINWMYANEYLLASPLFGADIHKIKPIVVQGGSDSSILDNMVELLVMGGRSLPHALMMLVPEAYESKPDMSQKLRGFYQYHATLMEPWDGPAAICFTDGVSIGAMLDRNGLRPARYTVTRDNLVVLASETGVLDIPAENVVRRGRVEPGSMILLDPHQGRIIENDELKERIAAQADYSARVQTIVRLQELEPLTSEQHREYIATYHFDRSELLTQQHIFGYTDEDVKTILVPMMESGEEPVGSMGTDTPLAVLSDKPQLFFNYFKQLFAQVTNPPIDPLREKLVMSLTVLTGRRGALLETGVEQPNPHDYDHCRFLLKLDGPVLTSMQIEQIRLMNRRYADGSVFSATTLSTLYPLHEGERGLETALEALCQQAERALDEGHSILILSDRIANRVMAPIPSLLAVSAVHHHLINVGKRTRCGLIVESGEPREVMHIALLIGYGASAVNPYLAMGTIIVRVMQEQERARNTTFTEEDIGKDKQLQAAVDYAISNYVKAIEKGLLKIFSKMGISTIASYRGAQMFEAVGVSKRLIDRYLPRTTSRIDGIDLRHLVQDQRIWYRHAFPERPVAKPALLRAGQYQWQRDGEFHAYNPATIHHLQNAVRTANYAAFKEYSAMVNTRIKRHAMLRGLLEYKRLPGKHSLPIHEVEPAEAIMKRFATGAMSFGSISKEAHELLAMAMNAIGGRSNTGEGGEDPERFRDNRRSAIKQVASGRFGVTSAYLVNADELQIKIAQGAKPGEGGQLPGHKVDAVIARVRHSLPGVTLISPPPHHDIYSIEDLAQLIFDLKNANPRAEISVKLVAESGVGVVAAGVAKAHADRILISGYDGGTGASPISSLRHAGIPWELGLAETQQVLVLNDLRGRVRLQVDGQMKTGRDVVIAALLGAEEYGFSTAALVAEGCILMRKCHLNTCPVGIATQRPELRAKFAGKLEHVITFFRFVAEEVREILAELGVRSLDELIGHTEMLATVDDMPPKASTLDFEPILFRPAADHPARTNALRQITTQDHELHTALDNELLERCRPALETNDLHRTSVELHCMLRNKNRTVGTMLGSEITRRFGEQGLPENFITLHCTGTAGQSLGAFIPRGLTIRLTGDANDYVGKGLSGGIIVLAPALPQSSTLADNELEEWNKFKAEENVIAGNTCLYGATSGKLFVRGRAGERFAVRNSGALAVVEGVGDHGCEYMTGGAVVVLGSTGRNFAAGMSGGLAFVYDPERRFATRCNHEMVDVVNLAISEEEHKHLLFTLLSEHVAQTGSSLGTRILEQWERSLYDFALVFPHEYRAYLQRARGLNIQASQHVELTVQQSQSALHPAH